MEIDTLKDIVGYDSQRITEKFRREAESEIWIDDRVRGRLLPTYLSFCVTRKWIEMVSRN